MNRVEIKAKMIILNIMSKIVKKWQKQIDNEMNKKTYTFFQEDLNRRIEQIKEDNFKKIITKYCDEEIEAVLKKDNYLTTYPAVFNIAVQRFMKDKESGKIDEFNNLVA